MGVKFSLVDLLINNRNRLTSIDSKSYSRHMGNSKVNHSGYTPSSGSISNANKFEKKLTRYANWFLIAFRWITLAVAAIQIVYLEETPNPSTIYYILVPVALYTILRTVFYKIPRHINLAYASVIIDLFVCTGLLAVTNGIRSPFLLYTLNPILMSAILVHSRLALIIALSSVVSVIMTSIYLSSPPAEISLVEISFLGTYVVAVILSCVLPQVINIGTRNQLTRSNIVEERKRLSRELHDGIAQTLAGLCWQIRSLKASLQERNLEISELDEIEELANTAQLDTRTYLRLLRSPSQKDNFYKQLSDYAEFIKMQTGIICSVHFHDSLSLSPEAEDELLNICREALHNACKHAEANNINISVYKSRNTIIVSICDDGHGFDTINPTVNSLLNGNGLSIMKERAESLGGRLDVISSIGKGTEILINIPAI